MTPPTLRKIGTAVVVRLDDGELLAVEFDGVYRRQQQRAKPRRFLREVFSLDPLTTIGKSTRLARQLSRAFATALITAGATGGLSARIEVSPQICSHWLGY